MKYCRVSIFPAVALSILVFNFITPHSAENIITYHGQIPTSTPDSFSADQQAGELFGKGFALHQSGEMEAALEAYDQALILYRAAHDVEGEGKTLSNMGYVCKDMGEYAQALNYYQQALDRLREAGDRFNEATAINNMALVYDGMGQPQKAIEYLQQALAMRREVGDRLGEGVTLSNFGAIYTALGDYEQALLYSQQALTIRREVGDTEGEAATLNIIGLTYWHLKQFKKAVDFYQKALALYTELDRKNGQGAVLNNLGEIYYDSGDYDKALDYYKQALDILRNVGARGAAGTVLNNLGETYQKLGQPQLALESLQQSLNILREIGQRLTEGIALNSIGEVYADQKQYDRALEYYKQALAIREEVGDRTGKIKTLHNMGWVWEQLGDASQAIAAYQQAVDVIESIESDIKIDDLKSSFASGQIETYEHLINLLWEDARFEEAFHYVERARARAFLDQLAGGSVDFRAGMDAVLLVKERDLRAELGSLHTRLIGFRSRPATEAEMNAIASIQAELEQREDDYTQLLTEIKIQSPEAATLVSVDVASLEEVQSLLDANTTLVEYFVTEDRILIFVITRNSFETASANVDRLTLENAITSFRDFASLNDPHPDSLRQLNSWLVEPVRNRLKAPVLGVIPHGVLHYLPFAALTNGSQYLNERYSLFTLPSASVLLFIQENRKSQLHNVLAFGDPLTDLPRLRFAEQEAEFVANLYGTKAWIGRDATESAIREQTSQAGILHLAAHGEYNPNNPLFSTIYLARDSENDGRLEVHEIFGLDLTKATDLVVLSACQTNIGTVSAGDEVVGLNRAFIYAGTPTVIASLWNVDDTATALLMEQFYTRLREGMNKAEALRQAQLEVRAHYPHPYYWAAFVLTGDPGSYDQTGAGNRISPLAVPGNFLLLGLCCFGFMVVLVGGIALRMRQRSPRS